MILQQGDVILTKVDSIPSNAKAVKKDRKGRGVVLAEGEATGHFHAIKDTKSAKLLEADGVMFLNIESGEVELTHQEHGTVEVPSDTSWKIDIVREYDCLEDTINKVRD